MVSDSQLWMLRPVVLARTREARAGGRVRRQLCRTLLLSEGVLAPKSEALGSALSTAVVFAPKPALPPTHTKERKEAG